MHTVVSIDDASEARQICTRQIAQTEWLNANSLRLHMAGYFV